MHHGSQPFLRLTHQYRAEAKRGTQRASHVGSKVGLVLINVDRWMLVIAKMTIAGWLKIKALLAQHQI
jgi:hypothetical protein